MVKTFEMLDVFGVNNEAVFVLDALGIKSKNPSFLTPWC